MVAIRLVPLDETHLSGVRELVQDPAARRFTRIPEPPPEGFERTWLALYGPGRADGTREIFAVTDEFGVEFLGLALAPKIDLATSTAELGYVLHPDARGRGVATAALAELTRWMHDELGIHRIELLIATGNSASRRVAQRCGYQHEGTHRSVFLKDGPDGPIRDDTEVWARLTTDPRE